MTGHATRECRDVELSLGVLVLGALEPAERPAVEAHVASCPRCTAVLAELAPLPGLLHRLDPIEHAPAVPEPTASTQPLPLGPPELRERLVQAALVEQTSRRRRKWAAAGAAAAVLVGVLLAGNVFGVPWGDSHADRATVASATDPRTAVRADVRLMPDDTGSEVALHLAGVTPGEHCRLVAVDSSGRRDAASTWVANYEGEATVMGHTSFPAHQITRLLVVTEAGRTLVEVPIHG